VSEFGEVTSVCINPGVDKKYQTSALCSGGGEGKPGGVWRLASNSDLTGQGHTGSGSVTLSKPSLTGPAQHSLCPPS
jgi:hypothetical protein